ncbi:MAG TPA: phospholipid carrier-dependent glycosyltransferase [Coleofasciculaceae cyanobacterium]
MLPAKLPTKLLPPWFYCTVGAIWLFSLAIRFWGLGRFNTLVFDEVYFVKFAHNYLTQTPFFDAHPPLSKYLIAVGMWIGNQLPLGQNAVNSLAGAPYSTWSYRWLNALTGSLVPLVAMGLAYQLTRRLSYVLISGWFMALDGLFLVESRYGLNNVYLVLFGLLGEWFFLLALGRETPEKRRFWLAMAGVAFAASASVKWNGLWFLLGIYGLLTVGWLLRWADGQGVGRPFQARSSAGSPLQRLTQLPLWEVGLGLGILPAIVYGLVWIPHLKLNAKAGFWSDFWELQRQMLTYHQQVGSGPNVHPYCSSWPSWLWMVRPVAYFYQNTNPGDPLPTGQSTLQLGPNQLIYDVHAMGNPMLWWLGTIAMGLVLISLIGVLFRWLRPTVQVSFLSRAPQFSVADRWLLGFLAINYLANLLPWTRVTRCTFLYHYMGASVFATMAIAWVVDRWLRSPQINLRRMGIAIMAAIGLGFLFWLPIYWGLPLSISAFRARIWFANWI